LKTRNSDIARLDSILDEYKFVREVPSEVSSLCLDRKSDLYKKILKTLGIYSLISAAVTVIFFIIKKSIPAFLSVSKVIIVATTVTAVSTGAYVVTKVIRAPETSPAKEVLFVEEVPSKAGVDNSVTSEIKKPFPKAGAPVKKYTLGIIPFSSTTMSTGELNEINGTVKGAMTMSRGKNFSGMIDGSNNKNVAYTMFGEIERLGSGYSLMIKVVNIETSQIEYIKRAKAATLDAVKEQCRRASADIAKKIR